MISEVGHFAVPAYRNHAGLAIPVIKCPVVTSTGFAITAKVRFTIAHVVIGRAEVSVLQNATAFTIS
jgi:hypothetical protein